MLAAAAVRLINYFVPTTELANQIADALHSGVAALDAFLIAAIAHVRLPPANGPAHLALSSIRNFPSAGSSSFGHAALASRFA